MFEFLKKTFLLGAVFCGALGCAAELDVATEDELQKQAALQESPTWRDCPVSSFARTCTFVRGGTVIERPATRWLAALPELERSVRGPGIERNVPKIDCNNPASFYHVLHSQLSELHKQAEDTRRNTTRPLTTHEETAFLSPTFEGLVERNLRTRGPGSAALPMFSEAELKEVVRRTRRDPLIPLWREENRLTRGQFCSMVRQSNGCDELYLKYLDEHCDGSKEPARTAIRELRSISTAGIRVVWEEFRCPLVSKSTGVLDSLLGAEYPECSGLGPGN